MLLNRWRYLVAAICVSCCAAGINKITEQISRPDDNPSSTTMTNSVLEFNAGELLYSPGQTISHDFLINCSNGWCLQNATPIKSCCTSITTSKPIASQPLIKATLTAKLAGEGRAVYAAVLYPKNVYERPITLQLSAYVLPQASLIIHESSIPRAVHSNVSFVLQGELRVRSDSQSTTMIPRVFISDSNGSTLKPKMAAAATSLKGQISTTCVPFSVTIPPIARPGVFAIDVACDSATGQVINTQRLTWEVIPPVTSAPSAMIFRNQDIQFLTLTAVGLTAQPIKYLGAISPPGFSTALVSQSDANTIRLRVNCQASERLGTNRIERLKIRTSHGNIEVPVFLPALKSNNGKGAAE